jgi:peroxiredoxin
MKSATTRRKLVEVAFLGVSLCLLALSLSLIFPQRALAQDQKTPFTGEEKAIADQIHGLRALPDDVRARTTKALAIQIRHLPVTPNKLALANGLASRATEGDFGHDALQEVATTLAEALRERPVPPDHGQPAEPYMELAQLVRYEHVQASSDDPQFTAAMSKLAAADASREHADFTLTDLDGKMWSWQQLRGKVVLVNFWATWCPPCRKEMPDLDGLYARFKDQGFVVLAISDEDADKVKAFIAEHRVSYPILLDIGRKVNEQFQVDGIPKSFVYDRSGKLVAESIDMRTQRQFLQMLAQAGLQ